MNAMQTSIDRAGRVVVPKALREALDLRPGMHLEISQDDGRLILEPRPVPMRLVRRGRGLVAVPGKPLPRLTAARVRATLEAGRR
jgi:AbrB family looped-hinge helix DNA binding protein